MSMVRGEKLDLEEVKEYIRSCDKDTRFYIGGDSEKLKRDGKWYADYSVVLIIHLSGSRGCKIFGETTRELDYDKNKSKPRFRLMNEVYKISGLFLELAEVLEDRADNVEIHLDLNPNKEYGSNVVIQEAIGYIKGTCNITPKVKPDAWSASSVADRFKEITAIRNNSEIVV